jgi:hypothetical protein
MGLHKKSVIQYCNPSVITTDIGISFLVYWTNYTMQPALGIASGPIF